MAMSSSENMGWIPWGLIENGNFQLESALCTEFNAK